MNRFFSSSLVALILFAGCISKEEHSKLGSDLKAAKESLSQAQKNLDDLGTQVEEKDQKITDLEEQVSLLKEQNTTFTESHPKLEKEVADLKKDVETVTKERDTLKAASTASGTKAKELETELAAVRDTVQKWRADYETLQSSNSNLKSRLNEVEARPKEDFIFDNSLVRYLRQKKKTENIALSGRDLSDEEKAVHERNKSLLAKSNKELTAEMGDYYEGKGTLDQMSGKYPDFAKKYRLIQKMRAESAGGGN